mgnify:CR=1 FL=1
MKVLGIDQSYSCTGLIVIEGDVLKHVEALKSPKDMDIHARANWIATHIQMLADLHSPDCVGIEGLAFGMRGDATRDLAGLQFVIINKLLFHSRGDYPIEIVAPNAVKKFATGNGKAKKEELYESLPKLTQERFLEVGVKKTTGLYDLTDAYWIAKATEEKQE